MASCSSSSDDENMDTFAQITNIVNSEVIQNGILNRHPTSTPLHLGSSDQRIPKPSLRHWRRNEDESFSTSKFITPEFRQHVAKKLTSFLDKNYICTQEAEHSNPARNSDPLNSPGIRLFLSSKQSSTGEFVKQSAEVVPPQRNHVKSSSSSESTDDEAEMRRLTEAAVSGHSIIQQVSRGVEDQQVDCGKNHKSRTRKPCDEETKRNHNSGVQQKETKRRKHKKEKHKDNTLCS